MKDQQRACGAPCRPHMTELPYRRGSTSAASLEVVDVEDGLHLRQQVLCQLPDLGVEQRRVVAGPDAVQLACAKTGKAYLSTWAHARLWTLFMLLQPACRAHR